MSLRVLTAIGTGKVGGAEAFFVTLTVALQRAGVSVHAVLRDFPVHSRALAAAGVPFDTARFGGPFAFMTPPRLGHIARKFRPDIVLTFARQASDYMPRGAYTLIGRLGGYYRLDHFRRSDYLICNTPDLVRYVVEGGWSKERVFHLPNFPSSEDSEAVSRASLDTPDGVPLALALGRLHLNKGLDVLLTAAQKLPELWIWIAGDGEERENLQNLARELGVAHRVKFLGWRTDRAGLFKAADVCVFPSRREPMGNVILEAWQFGVPIVATASMGPSWLIRDGEDGILTPVDDAGRLAADIGKVLSSPVLAGRLVANGRKRVADEFSEGAMVRGYIELFERLRPKAWFAA